MKCTFYCYLIKLPETDLKFSHSVIFKSSNSLVWSSDLRTFLSFKHLVMLVWTIKIICLCTGHRPSSGWVRGDKKSRELSAVPKYPELSWKFSWTFRPVSNLSTVSRNRTPWLASFRQKLRLNYWHWLWRFYFFTFRLFKMEYLSKCPEFSCQILRTFRAISNLSIIFKKSTP